MKKEKKNQKLFFLSRSNFVLCISLFLLSCTPAHKPAPKVRLYWRHIAPILRTNCVECHSQGAMNFSAYDAVYLKRAKIELRLRAHEMPPKPRQISEQDREHILQWILQGAAEAAKER